MIPALPAADFACAQDVTRDVCTEQNVTGLAAPQQRTVVVPPSVRLSPLGGVRAHAIVSKLLRLFVRALYVFPALILVKLALWSTSNPAGDYITIAFVVLVVAAFGVIAAATLTHLLAGPRSERLHKVRPVIDPPGGRDLDRVIEVVRGGEPATDEAPRLPPATAMVRVRGRVQAGLADGQVVLEEHWLEATGGIVRLFEGRSFAVDPADGPPLAVEIAGCPVLVGAPSEDPSRVEPPAATLTLAGALGHDLTSLTRKERRLVRQGDLVELVAFDPQRVGRLDNDRLQAALATPSDAGPYRGSQAEILLVHCTPDRPVIVSVV